jgi:hypothetical protein
MYACSELNGLLRDQIMRHSKQNSCEHAGITARSAMDCKHMVQWSSSTSVSGSKPKSSSLSAFGDADSSLMRFGGGVDDGPGMGQETVSCGANAQVCNWQYDYVMMSLTRHADSVAMLYSTTNRISVYSFISGRSYRGLELFTKIPLTPGKFPHSAECFTILLNQD